MTEQEWLESSDLKVMLGYLLGRSKASPREFFTRRASTTDRKLWLFIAAVERLWWGDKIRPSDEAVMRRLEVVADNEICFHVSALVGFSYHVPPNAPDAAQECVRIHNSKGDPPRWANLLREIFGNPFRPVIRQYGLSPLKDIIAGTWRQPVVVMPDIWLTYHDGLISKMAKAIYTERRWQDMPLLADALEEAGCTNTAILKHCRQSQITERCPNESILTRGSINGVYHAYEHCGPESRWVKCPQCDGKGTIECVAQHVRGCWVLDLLTGRE